MGLVSHEIPNILGGISQQAPSIRATNQLQDCRNAVPDPVLGLIKRNGTEHKYSFGVYQGADPFMYTCNRTGNVQHNLVITDDGTAKIIDGDGNVETLYRNTNIEAEYLTSTTPSTSYQAVSLADTIFLINRDVKTAKSTDVTPIRPHEGFIFIKACNYSTTYRVEIIKNGVYKSLEIRTLANTQPDISATQRAELGASTDTILKMFLYYFIGASTSFNSYSSSFTTSSGNTLIWPSGNYGLPPNMGITWCGSYLHVYNTNGDTTDFTLTVTDTASGNHLVGIKDEVSVITDLPKTGVNGFQIKVKGKNTDSTDDYWVVSDGTSWKECARPGTQYKFDPRTMPIQFRMDNSGHWHMEYVVWADRRAGDDTTNPWPSFTGYAINCIKIYKDRLIFLSEENYSISRLNSWDAFDFFRVITLTQLDTDPIDGTVSADDSPKLYHAVDFTNSLLMFGEFLQFKMTSQGPLTPNTATISSTTEFHTDPNVTPKGAGKFVFFASDRGDYGSLWEFSVDAGTQAYNATLDNANEVTNHVTKLLSGKIKQIQVSPNNQMAFVTTSGVTNQIFVYKYLWGDQGKSLSSWVIWEFSGDIKGFSVKHDTMVLLIQRGNVLDMETIQLNKDSAFTEVGQKILLDRRVKLEKNVMEKVPYTTSEPIIYVNNKGVQITSSVKDSLIATGEAVWAGVSYKYKVSLSQVYFPSQNGPVISGKLQMKKYWIQYANSGYFKVVKNGTSSKEFNGKVFSNPGYFTTGVTLTDGIFQFPATGLSDRCSITIENDSHLPCSIVGYRWEGYYITRSQNV